MKAKSLLALFAVAAITGWGCMGNPTNEPTVAEIQAADDVRRAAIENDPTLTPEQREVMMRHMGFGRNMEQQTRGSQ